VTAALGRHPRRGRIVLALLVASLACGALQLPSLGDMSDRHVGIVDFELARTASKAERYHRDLGGAGRDAARTSLYLDYPYLVLYGLFFAAACVVVAARAAERGMRRLARLGRLLALGALIGAACDAVENAALLRVLAGHTDQPWPGIAFGFATAKFALTIAAALFALVGYVLTRSRTPAAG
jgi:hypothetical protein